MPAEIRKTLTLVETTLVEGGRAAPVPLRLIAAVAVLKNPWAGRGFAQEKLGQRSEASQSYQRALGLDGNNQTARAGQARLGGGGIFRM